MLIVCDRNMPYAAEAFGTLGEVRLLDGRGIGPADVRDADILATRTTTRVNRELLDGSRVRFYCAATIGFDHVDADYLAQRGIPWEAAPGCNAESVAQYLTAALLVLAERRNVRLADLCLGVIGVGNVGRRVVDKSRALGMEVLCNDPPRRRDPADDEARLFVPLEAILEKADIVTLHVPLIHDGVDRTLRMCDRELFARMRHGSILINAARGELVDSDALMEACAAGHIGGLVLDTWEGEPDFRPDLLEAADLGTPHIAGHTYEGKVNGTLMAYQATCRFLGVEPSWTPSLPPPPVPDWYAHAGNRDPQDILKTLVCATYDIEADDRALRTVVTPDPAERRAGFDRLRKQYPMRREFASTCVHLEGAERPLLEQVRRLAFRLPPGD